VQPFEEQVRRHPHRLAVRDGERTLSYAELNGEANRIAGALLAETDAGRHPVVALLPLGCDYVCAAWGIWKAGKISVPVTPTDPDTALMRILNDVSARVLLCNSRTMMTAARVTSPQTRVINIDDIAKTDALPDPDRSIAPDDPAIIIYTSGSSGTPKGVIHSHRTYLQSVRCLQDRLALSADDRLSMLHTPGSISAQGTILCALLCGASIHPYDVAQDGLAHLAAWLLEARITFLRCIPTLFRLLAATLPRGKQFPDVRLCWLGGERVTTRDIEVWRQHFPVTSTFINNIGATETLSYAQYALHGQDVLKGSDLPVGYAHRGKVVTVRDSNGAIVPPGTVGEFVVESRFLSPGYWNRPELTRAKFRPAATGANARTYFTGDRGRQRKDGCLVYTGRQDDQVKIRGFRVETGAVETAIRNTASIDHVAVVPRKDQNGDLCLVAYLVENEPEHLLTTDLRHLLHERFPEYMVPSRFIAVAALPLTSTGKIDRNALPDLPEPPATTRSTVIGKGSVEHDLSEMWKQTLGIPYVGPDDHFFDLGGDSLHAVQILAAIEHVFGMQLPMTTLIHAPTVAAQADIIRSKEAPAASDGLVVLQPQGSLPPLFLVPPAASSTLGFRSLALHLGCDRPVYGFEPAGIDGRLPPQNRIEDMAAHYVRAMRDVQPHGPYYIGGRCLGGVVAFEMAQQLHAAEMPIHLLAVLDSRMPPGYTLKGRNKRPQADPIRNMKQCYYGTLRVAAHAYRHLFRKTRGENREPLATGPCNAPHPLMAIDPHERIRTAHMQARWRYIARRYPGRVTYFRSSGEGMREAWKHEWRRLCAGIDYVDIPGEHTTILHDAYVATVAAALRKELERAPAG